MSLITLLSDAFIPSHLRADEATYTKAKNLLGLAGAAVLAAPPFAGLYAWLGNTGGAIAIALTLPALVLFLGTMRLLGNLAVAQHGSMLTLFSLFCYLIWSMGGNPATAVNGWFAAVPLVATFMMGVRHGLWWLSLTLLAMLGFWWADATGSVAFPVNPVSDPRLLDIISNLGMVPFVAGLALFFQLTKDQSDDVRRRQVQTIQELMDEVAKLSTQVQSQVSRMVSSLDEQSREAQSLRSASEANLQLADRLQDTAATLVTDADQARRNADDGGTVVGTAIANTEALAASISQADELVRALQSRSQSISAIVDKIKGLAFQTNILALNATIEAAHAGAQGKGFAVVADNVRRLAGEAGDAASDIGREIGFILEHVQQTAQLLDSSQALADEGRGSAAMARDALQAIHASVCSVHAAMAHLQEVSAQQAEQNRSLQHVAGRIEEGIQQVAQGSGSINDAMGRLHARLHAH